MTFVPDSSASYQAYLYAKGLVPAEHRDLFDVNFIMFYCSQIDAAATLVANSGTRVAPNGSVATAINDANASLVQNRNF